jgi:hypothetical protein
VLQRARTNRIRTSTRPREGIVGRRDADLHSFGREHLPQSPRVSSCADSGAVFELGAFRAAGGLAGGETRVSRVRRGPALRFVARGIATTSTARGRYRDTGCASVRWRRSRPRLRRGTERRRNEGRAALDTRRAHRAADRLPDAARRARPLRANRHPGAPREPGVQSWRRERRGTRPPRRSRRPPPPLNTRISDVPMRFCEFVANAGQVAMPGLGRGGLPIRGLTGCRFAAADMATTTGGGS